MAISIFIVASLISALGIGTLVANKQIQSVTSTKVESFSLSGKTLKSFLTPFLMTLSPFLISKASLKIVEDLDKNSMCVPANYDNFPDEMSVGEFIERWRAATLPVDPTQDDLNQSDLGAIAALDCYVSSEAVADYLNNCADADYVNQAIDYATDVVDSSVDSVSYDKYQSMDNVTAIRAFVNDFIPSIADLPLDDQVARVYCLVALSDIAFTDGSCLNRYFDVSKIVSDVSSNMDAISGGSLTNGSGGNGPEDWRQILRRYLSKSKFGRFLLKIGSYADIVISKILKCCTFLLSKGVWLYEHVSSWISGLASALGLSSLPIELKYICYFVTAALNMATIGAIGYAYITITVTLAKLPINIIHSIRSPSSNVHVFRVYGDNYWIPKFWNVNHHIVSISDRHGRVYEQGKYGWTIPASDVNTMFVVFDDGMCYVPAIINWVDIPAIDGVIDSHLLRRLGTFVTDNIDELSSEELESIMDFVLRTVSSADK